MSRSFKITVEEVGSKKILAEAVVADVIFEQERLGTHFFEEGVDGDPLAYLPSEGVVHIIKGYTLGSLSPESPPRRFVSKEKARQLRELNFSDPDLLKRIREIVGDVQ